MVFQALVLSPESMLCLRDAVPATATMMGYVLNLELTSPKWLTYVTNGAFKLTACFPPSVNLNF